MAPFPRTTQRRPEPWRVLAWWYTGPLGHLVAGALDVAALLARVLWLRARGRRMEWF